MSKEAVKVFSADLSVERIVTTESVVVHAIIFDKANLAPVGSRIEIKDADGNVYSRIQISDINEGGSGWNTIRWLAGNGLVIGADPAADADDTKVSVFYSQGGA